MGDFYRWHLSLQSDKVLSSDIKEKMFRPVTDKYANGWYIGRTSRDTPVHYHGGYDTAVHLFAMLYRYPSEDTVVIVFGNTTMNDSLNRTYLSVIVERLIFGGNVTLPPLAAPIVADKLRKFEGSYSLEDGAKFQIRRDEAGLTLRANGSQAVLAATYPDFASEGDVYELDPRISEVLFGIEKRDYQPLQSVLFKEASFERAKAQWERRWKRFRSFDGSLQSVKAICRVETEYDGAREVQTHLLLEFERGTRLVRAIANADERYWFDQINLPRKVEIRLVPLSETELAGWNLRLQTGPRLKLGDGDENILTVHGKAGRLQATRDASN